MCPGRSVYESRVDRFSLTEQELPAYDLPDKASRGIRKMRHHSEQAPVEQAVRLLAVTR